MTTAHVKRHFLTGLLILVPLGVTVWVITALVGFMDQTLLLLPEHWRPERLLGFRLPGLGVLLTIIIVLVTGILAGNLLGQRMLKLWEGLLNRIPVVKSIYGSVKQVSDTLLSGNGHAFRKVLLVHYPHPEAWSLAFQTNVPIEVRDELGGEWLAVFIPTAPSPVNGFYFYVKRSETVELDVSVDMALKYIVSMGVVAPQGNGSNSYPGD
ncbi:DUF502 domain-containing protein [Parasulfuritortus cantonensis]|uniref:DUF502 domain-containing protein n=1 Tax=Parasulfuritortus cantonensis TaxID=2528202 RepID=A0A4R1BG03_9PROT|nr:DUF502 domain-containing protein [Parasulfuritortus cantonensis]TCJ15988.1 DUF502 domain-containing protein [Parasulfuritortus cantonensis]